MYIPQEIIEKTRESNDIVDVISEHVSLQRRGKNYIGLCPFHKEKTPSFSVQQDKQIYHCFGCGQGGNVITFIMKYRNLEFVEAVKLLAERANIVIPDSTGNLSSENSGLREKLFNINKEAARFFYSKLPGSKGIDYFKKRGIDGNTVNKFGLGFALNSWDALLKYLMSKGYSCDIIEKAGLIIRKKDSGFYDRFRNRVMFPVFDIKGRVIGFGGRVLDDSKPKYLNSPETLVFNKGHNLYGLNIVSANKNSEKIIIVEGYMDVIALHQYGINNAVASLGTALTKEQGRLLKRYCDEVLICYDSDSAGQAATLRGLDILTQAGCSVKVMSIPRGKDPDEFIRAEGREAFIECMNNAMPLIEYKIRRKTEQYDTSTTEGKIGFIKACTKVLSEIDDPVVVEAYISKLSGETGISASALYEGVSRHKRQGDRVLELSDKHIRGESRYNNIIGGQKLYLEPAYLKAEKYILGILYKNNGLFSHIAKKLSYNDFNDNTYRKVASIMYEKLMNNEEIIPASIIGLFTNPDEMAKVSGLFNLDEEFEFGNSESMVNDYISLVHRSKLMNERDSLILKIKESEKAGDLENSAMMLRNLIEIEKQLRLG